MTDKKSGDAIALENISITKKEDDLLGIFVIARYS
jgi:hypothetical protein